MTQKSDSSTQKSDLKQKKASYINVLTPPEHRTKRTNKEHRTEIAVDNSKRKNIFCGQLKLIIATQKSNLKIINKEKSRCDFT